MVSVVSEKRLAEIEAIADEDIDTSDIPEVGEEFFRKARITVPGEDLIAPESVFWFAIRDAVFATAAFMGALGIISWIVRGFFQ